jgi:monofunctional biosynthetic peptidoglycan transglycosylase
MTRKTPGRLRRFVARTGWVLRWTLRLLLVLLIVDAFYLAATWPDWKSIATGPVPKSRFIRDYEARAAQDKKLPRLRWQPVALSAMPKHLTRAVILAEDGRFYGHSGFDLQAFREAMDYNFEKGRLARGASTISQQTVKNLFLSSSRNPLRKWHELVLTWGMEQQLKKRRILEIYLNVAEFGRGIYGVQAAAQAYYGVDVQDLTPAQAAELAATLPGPTRHNPATGTRFFTKHSAKILSLLQRYPGDAADTVNAPGSGPAPALEAVPEENGDGTAPEARGDDAAPVEERPLPAERP